MLQVAVHRDHGLAPSDVEPGRQRDLVAEVARQPDDLDAWVAGMQLDGQTVGAVAAAVVDEDDLPGPVQGVEHRRQLLDESRQHLLLVVQRDDDRVPGCRLLHDS